MSDQGATENEPSSQDSLTSAVLAWTNARESSELQALIAAHWDTLNTNEADQLLGELLQQYAAEPEVVAQLRNRRNLLYRCRTQGSHLAFTQTSPTFDPDIFATICRFLESGSDEVRQIFIEHRETLVSDEAQRVLAHLERYYQDDDNLRDRVRDRRDCIRTAVDKGADTAFPSFAGREALDDALARLLDANDWPTKLAIIRTDAAVLLSDDADRYIEFLLSRKSNPTGSIHQANQALAFHRAVLARARRDGIDSIRFDGGRPPGNADAPVSAAERMEMDELLGLISARHGVYTAIHSEQIERLLAERPDLRKAWERLGPWLAPIDPDNADRAELQRIVQQLAERREPGDSEQRVQLMRRALKIPLVQQTTNLRAAFHADLANALLGCPGPDRAALLEEALTHAELAQTVWTKKTSAVEWADNRWSMGNIFTHRMVGGHTANIERALECFKDALEVLDAQRPARSRVTEYISLGNAYCLRVAGSKRDNIEEAIGYLQLALHDETFRRLDALTQGDAWSIFGNTMASRIAGDPADNMEEAIHALRRAQQIFQDAGILERLGLANYSLATALNGRHYGDPAENRSEAIKLLDSCLQLCPKDRWPERWAITMMSQASLIGQQGRTRQDFELALRGFKAAQTYFTRATNPHHWAEIERSCGLTLLAAAEASGQVDDIERATRHSRAALEVFDRNSNGPRWSALHLELGRMQMLLATHGSAGALANAEAHYRLSLEARPPDTFPEQHCESQAVLGDLLLTSDRWAEAHGALSRGIDAGVLAFEAAYTEVGRHAAIARVSLLFAEDAYALVRLQRYSEALIRLDVGKAKILAQSLALSTVDVARLDPTQRAELEHSRSLVQEIEARMRVGEFTPTQPVDRDMAAALKEARGRLTDLLSKARGEQPDLMPGVLTQAALLALPPPGGALVAPIVAKRGAAILVIPHRASEITHENVVRLDSFKRANFVELVQADGEGDAPGGWLGAYLKQTSHRQAWLQAIDQLGHELWNVFMGPVHAALKRLGVRQGAPVILMPQGGLALLPLHAAWREVDGQRRYFLEDYTVSHAPSGYALEVSRKRLEHIPATRALLAVINPTEDLNHAQAEGEALEVLLGDACLPFYRSEATIDAIREAAPNHTHIHFCCHGLYDWHSPMKSGLLLAGGQVLTLAEVIGTFALARTRLVTLSACETGITDTRRMPDEYIGLPAAFLNAGAAAVISTLWRVHDFATMLLMKRFYHHHLSAGEAPAAALRKAQQWLSRATNEELAEDLQRSPPDCLHPSYRSALEHFVEKASTERVRKPFEHPYYWAAFVLNGA